MARAVVSNGPFIPCVWIPKSPTPRRGSAVDMRPNCVRRWGGRERRTLPHRALVPKIHPVAAARPGGLQRPSLRLLHHVSTEAALKIGAVVDVWTNVWTGKPHF